MLAYNASIDFKSFCLNIWNFSGIHNSALIRNVNIKLVYKTITITFEKYDVQCIFKTLLGFQLTKKNTNKSKNAKYMEMKWYISSCKKVVKNNSCVEN